MENWKACFSFLFMLQPFGCISLSCSIRCIFFSLIGRVCLSCTFWHQPNVTGTPSLLIAQCHKKLGIMDALGPPNMEIFLTLSFEMPLVLLVLQIVGKSLLIRNASWGTMQFLNSRAGPWVLLCLPFALLKRHKSFVVETATQCQSKTIIVIVFRVKVILISSLVEAESMDLPRKARKLCH